LPSIRASISAGSSAAVRASQLARSSQATCAKYALASALNALPHRSRHAQAIERHDAARIR